MTERYNLRNRLGNTTRSDKSSLPLPGADGDKSPTQGADRDKRPTSGADGDKVPTFRADKEKAPTPGSGDDSQSHCLGFDIKALTSFSSLVRLLCRPTDPAGLAVMRIMFGLLMIIDIPQERGMDAIDVRWDDPSNCNFPLFDFLQPLPLQWMYVVYLIMLLGAVGIMLGLLYRLSCVMFVVPYWYIFFLDKTSWNNHSYLYGLIGLILMLCDANRCWSLDGLISSRIRHCHVPLWNYTLLRSQIFLVYFIAGLKKIDKDWIYGYSMHSLSSRWVFDPFRLVLTDDQIDLHIVHHMGLLIDLAIGFLLFFDKTRPVAFVFGSSFHLMNSQMFSIGMFSYTMMATLPLFCYPDWPRRLIPWRTSQPLQSNNHCVYSKEAAKSQVVPPVSAVAPTTPSCHHKLFSCITLLYISSQVALPYSHGVTKGYTTWTNGLYGYSWDMMVHVWSTQHIRITYRDLDTGEEGYIDPYAWITGKSSRWSSHPDMVKQYVTCIADRLTEYNVTHVEFYVDVWRSLNERFQQRVFNPNIDMLRAPWQPFSEATFSLPLLADLSNWREKLAEIQTNLQSASNYSSVVFVADFPGLVLENFIQPDLQNASIALLKGAVVVETLGPHPRNYTLTAGQQMQVPADAFHNVYTVSSEPSCYMYIYVNTTAEHIERRTEDYRHALNASTNGSDVTGKWLRSFEKDPYLQTYKDALKKEEAKQMKKSATVWQTFTHFLRHKCFKFYRSISFVSAAVRSITFGESFEEFRQSAYVKEILVDPAYKDNMATGSP